MALDGSFVLAMFANTFKYTFFKGYAQMVRPRSQGAFANQKLARHLPVMLDLLLPFEQMVVEDECLFIGRQKSQAF